MRLRLILCLLLPLFLAALAGPASAQQSAAEAAARAEKAVEPARTEDLQRVVDMLEDDARRKAFVEDLKSLIAVQKQATAEEEQAVGAQLLRVLSQKIEGAGKQLAHATEAVLDLPRIFQLIRTGLTDAEQRGHWLGLLVKLAAVMAAGYVAQLVAAWLLRKPYSLIEAQSPELVVTRTFFVTLRMVLDLVVIGVFVAAAYGAMTVVQPAPGGRVVALALINAIAASRAVLAVAKMAFAPEVAKMRLFPMGDETANYGFVWCRRLTYLAVYGFFGIEALAALGAPRSTHVFLTGILGLGICLMLIMLALQNRQAIAAQIRTDGPPPLGPFRRRLADVWHLLVIMYLVTIYGVWLLELPGGFEFIVRATLLSFLVVILAQGAMMVVGRLIRRGFSLRPEQRARFPGLEARANRYLPVLLTVSQVVLYGFAALAFLQIWGLDVVDWFSTPLGSALIARLTTIAIIVAVAMIVWEVVSAMIERYLSATDAEGHVIQRGQRVQTLLPLLRNVVLIVIAVMVSLTVLSELGVDTGPLIAGAGILGLAVGFGAQTFVKDVITGFFILVEDAVAVGDLVEVGGHSGKVEAMSIRSIQLRDIRGDVHRVPFSEVTSTVNRSKVFSFAFFDIGVAYREDVDHCMNVIREVGDEMREDAAFAGDIIEDIEIMGLESFGDSAIVIRTRIKVKAGKQRGIQRAFNRLLKKRFDAEGIEIPFPHRTIYFGTDSQGEAPPAHVQMLGEKTVPPPPARAPVQLTKPPEGEQSDFDEVVSADETEEAEKR
jgi:small conductance mechanosensitive channel